MGNASLTAADKAVLKLADPAAVINALSRLGTQPVPPWLRAGHPFPDGALPQGKATFAAIGTTDLLDVIAVRGPLHAIDGWSYLGRALNALVSGQTHAARHLAYYAELRAALSILASAGIGVFNKRNLVIDAAGAVHMMSELRTHDMAWLAIAEWAAFPISLERIIRPIEIAGGSLLDPFREFFPAGASIAAGPLMAGWGFDLQQGSADRDERNWSSYQPTALGPILTTPSEDTTFLKMFWDALRPKGIELERHLIRILLEMEARSHALEIADYESRYDRLDDHLKAILPFDFLTRVDEPVDHEFIVRVSASCLPAHPYSMVCRAGLLLRLANGMAEENLLSAGIQPTIQFERWWREFGLAHGLWSPSSPPTANADLWQDIDLALEDVIVAPSTHRHAWISALAGSAIRVCEAERAALWGLFQ